MGRGHDDRKSFRAPVADDCEGTLLVCDAQIHVRVLDQSSTGFKLSTEDMRLIPDMVDAVLDMDDGVQHSVQIRHVKQDGNRQTLGIKRLSTRMRGSDEPQGAFQSLRMSVTKAAVVLLLVIGSAWALQAAPVRKHLAELPLLHFLARHEPALKSGAVPAKPPATPIFNRDRAFEFQRYLDDDTADWLQLETVQRRMLRGLSDLCGGARKSRLAPAQQAFVDFAAKASMLELLDADQRSRLETELNRPLSGSALLQDIIKRYSAHESPEELSKQFGAMLFVSPEMATKYGVSAEVVAAVCKQIDEAFQPSANNTSSARNGVDADQIVIESSLRMKQLEASCRALLAPTPEKPAP